MDLAPTPAVSPDRSLAPEPLSQTVELAAPTTLTPPIDRPDLQVYASAMNAGFDTGLDDTGRLQSPATANARLADVALADGPEAAAAWLPQLGIVRNAEAIVGLQTVLRSGAPGVSDVLDGQLDPRLAAQNRILLAQGQDLDDAVMVTFPDQQITSSAGIRVGGLGHAGILLIDDKTGFTSYYEYGRYDDPQQGIVLQRDMPNAQIDPSTGRPTRESLEAIFDAIAVPNNGGEPRDIRAAYLDDRIDFDRAYSYAEGREAMNSDSSRESYNIFQRNCAHFMRETAVQGGAEWLPWITIPTPNAYMDDVRVFNAGAVRPVDYDGDTGRVTGRF